MKKLFAKIMIGLLLLVAAAVGLLWFYQVFFLEQQYLDRKITGLQKELNNIYAAETIRSEADLQEALEAAAYRNNVEIERVDRAGETVFSTEVLGRGMQRPMGRMQQREQLLEAAMRQQPKQIMMTHARFQTELLMLGLPVIRDGEVAEVLLVSMPMEPVEETVALLKNQLLLVSGVLVLLTVLIGAVLTGMVVKPITLLTEAARQIATGKWDTRVPVRSRDEIGQLTGSFNEMAEQLGQIESLRRDFIANVSHELRTPLSLIQGYAETIRDLSGNNPGKRMKHAGIILDESRRLSRLVDDLLYLSQLQSGTLKLNRTPVDMNRLLDRAVYAFELPAEQKGITLLSEERGRGMVSADEGRMEQVVVNLLSNAFHHTPDGGTIRLVLEEVEDQVEIRVEDTGSGIPKEELDQIWDRHYQSKHLESKNGHKGFGIGLAIVKSILESHDAHFGVRSRMGEGSTFWFRMERVHHDETV